MAKEDKLDIRNAKRSADKLARGELRLDKRQVKDFNKGNKADVKRGAATGTKASSSKLKTKKSTNSPRKPSMPVKTGVKNKMKTQGKAATHSGKGYMRTGKK
jgi:hypothetical protein